MNRVEKILAVCAFVVAELIIVSWSLDLTSTLLLDKDQLLYFSATLAQVVATLYGLTITGYIFLDQKLQTDDETLYEIVNELRNQYRKQLTCLGVVSFLSIVFCMCNIVSGARNESIIYRVILNNSACLSVFAILCDVLFTVEVLNPYKIEKESQKIRQLLDKKNKIEAIGEEYSVENLTIFLKCYNDIEKMVREYINNCNQFKEYKYITLQKNMQILVSDGILDKHKYDEFNVLRRYRNALIHGQEMKVSFSACEKVKEFRDYLAKQLC